MAKCVFCPGTAVSTTNTTTPSEAFPFLCAQLGMKSQGRADLCATCHSTWEEVTLLYTNMQGLVNLMGRRVGQLRQKLRNDQHPPNTGGKNGKRKRMSTPITKEKESPAEEMLNWWYPSMAVDSNHGPSTTTMSEANALVNVKSEAFEEVGLDDEGGSGDESEMEDIEITPEDDQSVDSENGDDDGDPNYDPLASSPSFCTRTRSNPGSSSCSSTPGKTKPGLDHTNLISKTMTQAVFDLVLPWLATRRPVICKEGYTLYLKKYLVDKISWTCTHTNHTNKSKCDVHLYSTKDFNNLSLLMEYGVHNHPPDLAACEKRKWTSRIMLDAASCDDPPKAIVDRHLAQMAAENPTGTIPELPIESIKQAIGKLRRQKRRESGTGEIKIVKKKDHKQVIYYSL